ncbi:hypothetical protein J6590_070317 [Homalodisca vitripennis]|nr:hypothetical protein J6590_070317 [Homalodisca vitripennis]
MAEKGIFVEQGLCGVQRIEFCYDPEQSFWSKADSAYKGVTSAHERKTRLFVIMNLILDHLEPVVDQYRLATYLSALQEYP